MTLDVGDPGGGTLCFAMPLHAARRDGLVPGVACAVSLLRDGIHLIARNEADIEDGFPPR